MNYIIWNKVDKINDIDAQYFIDDLKIRESDGVFLIGTDLDNIQSVEIDRIIKSVYNLDTSLTTEEVAQEYVRIKEEEKLKAEKERITLEEQSNKIATIKDEQVVQNEEITTSMTATTEIYEMILAMSNSITLDMKNIKNKNNSIVNIYVALIQKGVKTIEDVPMVIRQQVQEQLNLLNK